MKYPSILIDSRLSWRNHRDYISSRISKEIRHPIARLGHFVPTIPVVLSKALSKALIESYIFYGLTAWGQASCQIKPEQNSNIFCENELFG